MGSDDFSDWEGLYYTFEQGKRVNVVDSVNKYIQFKKMTTSANQLASAVDQFFVEDGSFAGFISDGSFPDDTSKSQCVVNVFRITKETEVTKEDNSVLRVTAGRTMVAKVWDNVGSVSDITFVL